MLREKGKWRRLFGLKGHFYYYSDEPKKKLAWSSIQWAAVIAAISTISTAIFAFQNLRLSKAAYALAHPPTVVGTGIYVEYSEKKEPYLILSLWNPSEGTATDVHALIDMASDEANRATWSTMATDQQDMPPRSGASLKAVWGTDQHLGPRRKAVIHATVFFKNLAGDAQSTAYVCGIFDGPPNTRTHRCPEEAVVRPRGEPHGPAETAVEASEPAKKHSERP